MRHDLILESRTDGHPFRSKVRQVGAVVHRHKEESDIKLFALSFAAFFVCFYTFLL